MPDPQHLDEMSVGELLALSRSSLVELRRRGVIRTGNAPTGDYAELLIQRATKGELATASRTASFGTHQRRTGSRKWAYQSATRHSESACSCRLARSPTASFDRQMSFGSRGSLVQIQPSRSRKAASRAK
jgi:hypothetical protein